MLFKLLSSMPSNNKSMFWKVLFVVVLILSSSHMAFGRHIADATRRRSGKNGNCLLAMGLGRYTI